MSRSEYQPSNESEFSEKFQVVRAEHIVIVVRAENESRSIFGICVDFGGRDEKASIFSLVNPKNNVTILRDVLSRILIDVPFPRIADRLILRSDGTVSVAYTIDHELFSPSEEGFRWKSGRYDEMEIYNMI